MPNKHATLSALFTDIADAIREVMDTTDTIVADTFPDYIRELTYVKPTPILAKQYSWRSLTSEEKQAITKIVIMDRYTPTGSETRTWDASANQDGSVTGYLIDSRLIISGNGSGYIKLSPNAYGTFGWINTKIEAIEGLTLLDTTDVTSMGAMFYQIKASTLDVSSFNTSNVTSFIQMFRDCSNLSTLTGTADWDTSNVTNMSSMFSDCSALSTVDAANWNTAKVTTMNAMFQNCKTLATLSISSWNTAKVTDMSYMFYNCPALTSLNLNSWSTGNVTDMTAMFQQCQGLTSLTIKAWNVSNVTSIAYMFTTCNKLTSLDLANWNTAKVTNMTNLFGSCSELTSLIVTGWNTAQVTNMSAVFNGLQKLTSLDLSSWNTAKVTNMSYMFAISWSLITIYASSRWSTTAVTSSSNMFQMCYALKGAISWNSGYVDKTYAKTSGGYLTYKAA